MNNLIYHTIALPNSSFEVFSSKEIEEGLEEARVQVNLKIKKLDKPLDFIDKPTDFNYQIGKLSFVAFVFFSAVKAFTPPLSSSFSDKVVTPLWVTSLGALIYSFFASMIQQSIAIEEISLARSDFQKFIEKTALFKKESKEKITQVEWAQFVEYIEETQEKIKQTGKQEKKNALFNSDEKENFKKLFNKIHVINVLNRSFYETKNMNKLLAKIFWLKEENCSNESIINSSKQALKVSKSCIDLMNISPDENLDHPLLNRLVQKVGGLSCEEYLNKVKDYLPSPDERVISKLSIKAIMDSLLFPTLFNQRETSRNLASLFDKSRYSDISIKFKF